MEIVKRSASQIPQEVDEPSLPPTKDSPLDAARFEQVHRQSWDRLVNNLTGIIQDRNRAEDIASAAFEKAWEKKDQFRGEAAPSTWIQSIGRNDARSLHKSWHQGRVDSIDRPDSPELIVADRMADELEKQDDLRRLQAALECVPPKYRRALTGHFVEGLSVREIAAREHVPEGTVLSRVFTAKQLLRHAWERSLSPDKMSQTKERLSQAKGHGSLEDKNREERSVVQEPQSLDR